MIDVLRKQRKTRPRPRRKNWIPRGGQYGPRPASKQARVKAQRQAGKAQARAWGALGMIMVYLPTVLLIA